MTIKFYPKLQSPPSAPHDMNSYMAPYMTPTPTPTPGHVEEALMLEDAIQPSLMKLLETFQTPTPSIGDSLPETSDNWAPVINISSPQPFRNLVFLAMQRIIPVTVLFILDRMSDVIILTRTIPPVWPTYKDRDRQLAGLVSSIGEWVPLTASSRASYR